MPDQTRFRTHLARGKLRAAGAVGFFEARVDLSKEVPIMRISKRLKLAATLAPLLGALAFAVPAHAAPPGGGAGERHFEGGGGRGDFHRGFHDHDRHDFDRFGFGFGFGFGDPWWGWDPG